MKRIIGLAGLAILATALLATCAGAPKTAESAATPQPAAAASAAPLADSAPVAAFAPAVDTDGNSLASTIGPVSIVVDRDVSVMQEKTISGATLFATDYQGKKAIKVTKGSSGKMRVAFVLKTPTKLTGFKTLTFSVAGFEGYAGHYNCALIFNEQKPGSPERLAAFYVSNINKEKWTTLTASLVGDEAWAHNFREDRELVAIQFWTDKGKAFYVSDLALTK